MASRSTHSDDLGLGRRVDQQPTRRLLNRDGSFNVERSGLPFWQSLHLFHSLLKMSWWRFNLTVITAYLAFNALFAGAFWLAGPGAVIGFTATPFSGARLLECFFFSVQTFSTIGYGGYVPATLTAHGIVTVEAIAGMFFVALATGIVFARFSQPNARLILSKHAIIAPFKGRRALMFRVANRRKSQLLEVEATVVFAHRVAGSAGGRSFHPLKLEREKIMFMPLHWVVVHPIDEDSPLWGMEQGALDNCDAEFLILLKAVDETFSQPVQSRASYGAEDVRWGVKFADIYEQPDDGFLRVDLSRLSETEPAESPAAASQ
jgi:inward rectifier potassium channel